MSSKELQRVRVMEQLDVDALTLQEAAERMGVCYRQARRIRQRWLRDGPSGLMHDSRGRVSNRRRPTEERAAILARYGERYGDFGPTFASEKLAQDGMNVARETLRRWLIAEHLWRGPRRERKHRCRRQRRARFGELVQLDGSDHAWFEDRGPSCTLMVMVDDATSRVERANGTLQDRLVKEMRLAGVSTIEEGNAFLEGFLGDYNARFARAAAQEANLHRVVAAGAVVEDLVAYETTRQVQNDWTVTYESQVLQIVRQPGLPPAKSRVTVRDRAGGELALVWQGRNLAFESASGSHRPSEKRRVEKRHAATTTVLPAPAGAGALRDVNRSATPHSSRTGEPANEGG